MTGPCAAVLWSGPCAQPATTRIVAMCVHEHIRDGLVCSEHAEQWAVGYRPDCQPCGSGPERHSCRVVEVAPATTARSRDSEASS